MSKERRYSAVVLAGLVLVLVSGLRIFGQGGEGGGREARAWLVDRNTMFRERATKGVDR